MNAPSAPAQAGARPRVLVTGAAGFIGLPCLPLLVAQGYEVHAVSSRPRHGADDGIHWHQVDLLEPDAVRDLCATVRADHLLHLAWVTTPGAYARDPMNLEWTAASLHLIRRFAEHGGTRVVGAGTCFEYAHRSDERLHETTSELSPETLYGTCKVALHAVMARYADEIGLSSAWGRVFFLYGPREHPHRLVSSVIVALLEDRDADCTIGTQVRDFLHVDDVAGAFVALLRSGVMGPVNLASGQITTVRDLVMEIGEQLDLPYRIRLGTRPLPPSDPAQIVADVTRLRDEVGFEPRFELREGLADTIAWWRRHRDERDAPDDRSMRP